MPEPILASASQQDIYNMALGHISVAPVADINENSEAARSCNQFWPSAIRDALRLASWDFATVFITLAQSGNYQNNTQWAFAYIYPTNCLKLWKIISPQTGTGIVGTFPGVYPNTQINSMMSAMRPAKYQVRYDPINNQKVILTNVAQAIGEYTVPVTDVTLFDASFVKAASLILASYISSPLINDNSRGMDLVKMASIASSDAMRLNDEESPTDRNYEGSAFLDARDGGCGPAPQFWNSPSTSQY